ncbi:hypothetical protein [Roseovarius sp. MBR-6]|uniref:hypothetical protein n=1 Tax=Roseovarius sp. MBR-6 TaxID=3156459 RepID=UPI00339454EA
MQVIALNDQVAIQPGRANALVGVWVKGPKRHRKVMIPDEFLALEYQFRHRTPPALPR